MITRQWRRGMARAGLVLGLVMTAHVEPVRTSAQPGNGGYKDIYLPLAWDNTRADELAVPRAVTAAPTDPPTATATPTATPEPTATDTPGPTATPTPSPTPTLKPTPAMTGRITGRITDKGKPIGEGFGEPGTPQIELRRKSGADTWVRVGAATTDANGRFVFENPPALGPGGVYQVWWNNAVEDGADLWLHRWWSRDIVAFGTGRDVDVGTFEVANLDLTTPCHDCLSTAPITFQWDARDHAGDVYRWSIFEGCGDVEARVRAWHSAPLGRRTTYITSPPSGFGYDIKYCWYVLIEDGANGSGWPFFDRRVTFCSSPATCRGARAGRAAPRD